jgi:hypothetical protein
MAWTTVSTQISGATVTAVLWNELVNNMLHLEEVAYAEITSDVSVTATTAASPTDVVSSGALTYTAVPHIIEWFSAGVAPGAGNTTIISLWDGSTHINRIATHSESISPSRGAHRITPTAASHTYRIRAHRLVGNGTIRAGAAAAGDDDCPAFIRIYKVIT